MHRSQLAPWSFANGDARGGQLELKVVLSGAESGPVTGIGNGTTTNGGPCLYGRALSHRASLLEYQVKRKVLVLRLQALVVDPIAPTWHLSSMLKEAVLPALWQIPHFPY